ncbi:MAG: hypothetical protein F6K23_01565 [Okeania sp. SIO2C9]|uniref:hypothetical protein n=1 Tax=Okeania sp. SIO2C9 TaxID=2607791 RepID=UPI0013C14696|nr:hypothetical protein [Okeania sp. SIO2C9]NEQ71881.1 hypothetical protein [Okeania sp. SIO2C9]
MNKNLSTILAVFVAIYSTLITTSPAISSSTSDLQTIQVTPENLPKNTIAQTGRYAFSIIWLSSTRRRITLKSVSTGNRFDVYYASPISPKVGDMITVIMDNGRWNTLINERTGKSSAVSSVQRKY